MNKPLTFKNIILWRHAEAEELLSAEKSDFDRLLTEKGKQQAEKMAKWLKQNLPKKTLVLSSPALRTVETVKALKKDYKTEAFLAPGTTLKDVVSMMEMMNTENILLVGHQPWLGQLVNYLINIPAPSERVKMANIKKGAVWWFKQPSKKAGNAKLVAVQHPDFL